MEPAIEKQMVTDQIRDRNIVDMLRDDSNSGSKKNWKAFRDKLRLKRAGRAWTSSVPIPASDLPIQTNTNRMMTRRGSSRYASNDESDSDANLQNIRLLPVETDSPEEEQNSPADEQKPAEEETDPQSQSSLGDDGSALMEGEEEGGEEEHQAEEEEEDEGPGEYQICCGCTVKHKGAALGPCGHTYCKNCTKEHRVQRGHCPSCTKFILEILDIY